MRNEDRIVELLSESLKKQDQHNELLKSLNDNQIKIVNSIDSLADLVKHALNQLKRLDEFEDRLRKLERHTGLE